MAMFRYLIVNLVGEKPSSVQERLDDLGLEEWELVAVQNSVFYFKREEEEEE